MSSRTPEETALRRIRKAARDKATDLDLRGLGLKALPPEIGDLANLQWLLLHNNLLEELPPQIGKLDNLRVLRLDNNHLAVLPPQIGNFANLRELHLDSNQLEVLPP